VRDVCERNHEQLRTASPFCWKRRGRRECGLAGSAVGGWNADGKLTWDWSLMVCCACGNGLAVHHGHSDVLLAVQNGRVQVGFLQGGDKGVCKQKKATSE